jgi:hypothetical protein
LRPTTGKHSGKRASPSSRDTSDAAVLGLLDRLRATDDPVEIQQLSDQIERIVFHKQYDPA